MQNAAVSLHIFAIIGMILKSLKFIKIRMEFLRVISCSSHEGCPFHSRYSQMGVLGNHFACVVNLYFPTFQPKVVKHHVLGYCNAHFHRLSSETIQSPTPIS